MIGIVGGLGIGATIHYYTALVAAFRQRDLEARLLIAHAEAERVRPLVGDRKLEELATISPALSTNSRPVARPWLWCQRWHRISASLSSADCQSCRWSTCLARQ
jgi:hypothetical protein